MSCDSCALALWVPKDCKLWFRIYWLTQKMLLLFGACFFLTILHVLGLYLFTSVSQPSLSQTPYLGWIYSWFSVPARKWFCWVWLYRVCIMKSIGIVNVLSWTSCVSPVTISTHPILPWESLPWTSVFNLDHSTDVIGNIQHFMKGLSTQFERHHMKSEACWSSLGATRIRGTSGDAVIKWQRSVM